MKKIACVILLLCGAFLWAVAQTVPVDPKQGKVSDDEVAMTVYPLDTTAASVVLAAREEVQITTTDLLEMTNNHRVYERIKILKENGKSQTDYKFFYFGDAVISTVKVTTYNMVDGKVVKTKLDRKYIFREKVADQVYSCSFSAPEVRVGSVVEVYYEVKSNRFWDYPELIMQRNIPINWIAVSMEYPDFLKVHRMSYGYLYPKYSESVVSRSMHNDVYPFCEIHTEEFSLTDVPAIPREPSCLYPDQYCSSVSYELSGVSIPGLVHRNYSVTWPDVDKLIRQTSGMSQFTLKGKILDPFVSASGDEMAAITEVRNSVMAAVKWNGSKGLFPGSVQDMLKEGSGSSSTVNALVSSVLIKMGYRVNPVFIRRRSMGVLLQHYVHKDAFSDVILQVTTPSGVTCYIDAAPDYSGINIMNPLFLVKEARVVPLDTDLPGHWVDLSPLADSGTLLTVSGKLQDDGIVRGAISLRANKEAAYQIRQLHDELGSDEAYIRKVQEGECYETVSGQYNSAPFSPEATFSIEYEQDALANGELLYVRPFLMTEHHPGMFPDGERHTPVDFIIREALTYIYTLELPDSYVIEQLPQTRTLRSPSFNAMASFQVKKVGDNIIQVNFVYKNRDLLIPAECYEDLRSFWEQLCSFYQETIILRKK